MGIKSFFARHKIKKVESELEGLAQKLNSRKNDLPAGTLEKKLEDIVSKQEESMREKVQFHKDYPGERVPGRADLSLPSYLFGNTTEADRFDGYDLTHFHKTAPGTLNGATPALSTSGEIRPDNFSDKIAKSTQVAFGFHLHGRIIGKDAETDKEIGSKGILQSLQDGEIISSDLRRRIHKSVNTLTKAQTISAGGAETTAAIEHELVTLLHLKSRELLVEELNTAMNYGAPPANPNEATRLKHIAGPAGPRPNALIHPIKARDYDQAINPNNITAATGARVQQLQALGFDVPDPAIPPRRTLKDIADKITDPAFDLASPEGKRFMNNIPDAHKEPLKNLIISTKRTQHDLNERKTWADEYNRELGGAKSAELRKVGAEYKHLLERKETLSHITANSYSSVDALLAAGSAVQATITAPPGKLDAEAIKNRVGEAIHAGAREGENLVAVTTRADNTKSVVHATLAAVENDAKNNKSVDIGVAGLMSKLISHNVFHNQDIDHKIADYKAVGFPDNLPDEIKELHTTLRTKYQENIDSKDAEERAKAKTEVAMLTSLGATVYIQALEKGETPDNAKALAKKLINYSPDTLTNTGIKDIIEKEAKGMPALTQQKLIETARVSVSTSKGLAASQYEAPRQAHQKFLDEAKKVLPPNLALKLTQGVHSDYLEGKAVDEKNFTANAENVINQANIAGDFIHVTVENKAGDLKLTADQKPKLSNALINKYFETGKLEHSTIQQTLKDLNIETKNIDRFCNNVANPSGELNLGGHRDAGDFKLLPDNKKGNLKTYAISTYEKIPQEKTKLQVSTAAESAGYDPAQAKAAGELAARMKHVENKPDVEISRALNGALPSNDPVVKTAVFSSFEFGNLDNRVLAIKNGYVESNEHGRETKVALAITGAAKSILLTSPYADAVAGDLISHPQGYLAQQHQIDYDACIDNGRPAAGQPNAIPDELKAALKQSVRAAHAVAIGKIAGEEAVTTYKPAMSQPNANLKNMREVAAVSAATALSEGLSEDLSLEIGKQMAKHYADSKGVMDEKNEQQRKTLIEDAFKKFPPNPPLAPAAKNATIEAILRPTKVAAGLTQRGTAHAGTTVANAAVPVLPQHNDEKIRCQAKALAVAHLCASGDNENKVEIGNALAVTSSGLEASKQQTKSVGAIAAAAGSANFTIFTGFEPPLAGGPAPFTAQSLAQSDHYFRITANIRQALTATNSDLTAPQRNAIADSTHAAIQKAASRQDGGGNYIATPNEIAVAGSIAASTTTAALEANLSDNEVNQLGQSFAEIKHDLDAPPQDIATAMEISYGNSQAKALSNVYLDQKPVMRVRHRNNIEADVRAAQIFIDSAEGVGLNSPLQQAMTAYQQNSNPKTIGKVNQEAQKIVDDAVAKAEEKRFPLDLGAPLQAAKRAEAASAAAMAIAKLPGVPSSTLKLVRDRANYYRQLARKVGENELKDLFPKKFHRPLSVN